MEIQLTEKQKEKLERSIKERQAIEGKLNAMVVAYEKAKQIENDLLDVICEANGIESPDKAEYNDGKIIIEDERVEPN